MKVLFIIFYLLFPSILFSQSNTILLDKKSKKPIPYASIFVKDQLRGTSSNFDGTFQLQISEGDSLIFSSIGYETLTLTKIDLKDTIFLHPQTIKLNEVQIKPRKKFKIFPQKSTLGSVKNSYFDMTSWRGTAGYPSEYARYFKYDDKISNTRFIESVTFVTDSEINEAIFLVKFYHKGENGLPGELINANRIIGTAKKGRNKTVVAIEGENIYFPPEGLFVAVEFLIVDQNRVEREKSYFFEGNQYQFKYMPFFSMHEVEEHSFYYSKDIKTQLWSKFSDSIGPSKGRNILQCKITLIE